MHSINLEPQTTRHGTDTTHCNEYSFEQNDFQKNK